MYEGIHYNDPSFFQMFVCFFTYPHQNTKKPFIFNAYLYLQKYRFSGKLYYMNVHPIPIIAIDGTSSSGKGTLAYRLALHFGYNYLNSGALYRLSAHLAVIHGISLEDHSESNLDQVVSLMQDVEVAFQGKAVIFKGVDIWPILSSQESGNNAAKISFYPPLRYAIRDFQRSRIQAHGLVAEGRDMCTEVFPDAKIKIFLDASVEERAKRRLHEEERRGSGKTIQLLIEELRTRDAIDKGHLVGGLRIAEGAHVIDNSDLTVIETINYCIVLCEKHGVQKVL